jgi:hypothetical protein
MSKHRFTDDEYAKMADSYEAEPPRADEMRSIRLSPAVLRMGRPAKDVESSGKTPPLAVRLPAEIRIEIDHRVEAGESGSASELIRQAIVEYFDRHPAPRR